MTLRKLFVAGFVCALVLAAKPVPASADWLFTPFVGGNFGGDTADKHFIYGGSLAGMGAGIAGFELDFGYAPDFFESGQPLDFVNDSNVTTLMGNLILGAPVGPVRPYVVAGAGLLRLQATSVDNFFSNVDTNSFGYDLGGGVMGFFNDHVGVRADLRYFRQFKKDDAAAFNLGLGTFDLWRGTVGMTFKF